MPVGRVLVVINFVVLGSVTIKLGSPTHMDTWVPFGRLFQECPDCEHTAVLPSLMLKISSTEEPLLSLPFPAATLLTLKFSSEGSSQMHVHSHEPGSWMQAQVLSGDHK